MYNFKNIFNFILWIFFISFFLFLLAFNRNSSVNTKDFVSVEKITKGIFIEYEDINKKSEQIELPYVVKTDKPFKITTDLKYFGTLYKRSIGLYTGSLEFNVRIGNDLFFDYKIPSNSLSYNGGSSAYMIIDLPFDTSESLLEINFNPKLKG